MTGLEKIIAKIDEDCKAACEDIIRNADGEAQTVLDTARAAAAQAKEKALQDAGLKCRKNIEIAVSRAEHEHKKALLALKTGIIHEMIEESMQRLMDLPAEDYFKAIMALVRHYAQDGHGTLCFSKRDLDRLPKNFKAALNEMLRESDKSIEINNVPAVMDGGFIIIYQDIEQNCSFLSLLNASLDEIKDDLYQEIFMREPL